ncbi:MAG TPA: thiamine pyrophosphate-binding protein [Polyangiaceae bacterium]|nr:thiamine pyrophosphate-binding protein [Polyangiaceae bacterium]
MSEHPHGGSIVGEVLRAHGVKCLYNLCGGHISPILIGAKEHGLCVVDMRHEVSAAFAADAASRLTGIPGVCAVTAGPGVTNTVTAVKNAFEGAAPLVILGGATATVLRGRGSLQDIDQLSIMKTITKWADRCNKVKDLVPMLEKAFAVASQGVPGPVFLEIPVDVLYPESIVAEWYMKESGVEKMKGAAGAAAQLALKGYLKKQFHMPHIPIPGWPSLRSPIAGNVSAQVDEVAQALGSAKKPVLVIGNQAMVNLTPERAEELAEAVRRLGLPTFLAGSIRGLLGRHSEIQFRHKRSAALKEADVVIIAGFPFDFRLGYGQKINKQANLISVNLDPAALKKNRKPTLAVQAHPGHFLVQLSERAKSADWAGWFAKLAEAEKARDAEVAASARPDGPLIDPVHLFSRMEEKLADDSVLIVSAWSSPSCVRRPS